MINKTASIAILVLPALLAGYLLGQIHGRRAAFISEYKLYSGKMITLTHWETHHQPELKDFIKAHYYRRANQIPASGERARPGCSVRRPAEPLLNAARPPAICGFLHLRGLSTQFTHERKLAQKALLRSGHPPWPRHARPRRNGPASSHLSGY